MAGEKNVFFAVLAVAVFGIAAAEGALFYGRPGYIGRGDPLKRGGLAPRKDFKALAEAYRNLEPLISNIHELEKRKLKSGTSSERFWGYHNSPTYRGGLAMRSLFSPKTRKWPSYNDDFRARPPLELFKAGKTGELSAAAKYDFLFGPEPVVFRREISYARKVYARAGKVPKWAGICHGTAPASFSWPEPLGPIEVQAYNGKSLRFSQADLKRLAAHTWAENKIAYAQTGSRCFQDRLGSRLPECLDVNPADFHLALLNYIGINRKTFIVDNAYDSKVWNRPVVGFKFKYRHPKTKLPSNKLKYSLYPVEEAPESRARHFSADAVGYVGVEMKVKLLYGQEEGSEKPAVYEVVYYYDLEIGKSGDILGGEWETAYHPDFLWAPLEGTSPATGEDNMIEAPLWDGKRPLSKYIGMLGTKAARRGELLQYIVKSLIKLSREHKTGWQKHRKEKIKESKNI